MEMEIATQLDLLDQIAIGIAMVITAATGLSAITPTQIPWARAWINIPLRVLNILAGNFGFNRNEDDS